MLKVLMVLLTGFGPFYGVPENTSERILPELTTAIELLCGEGKTFSPKVLKVEPGTLGDSALESKEVILSFGVHPGSEIRIERAARNIFEGALIDPKRPLAEVSWGSFVPTSLEGEAHGFQVKLGNETSAGQYVCNDTYYRAIQAGKRAYFIHIPNTSKQFDKSLTAALSEISCTLLE